MRLVHAVGYRFDGAATQAAEARVASILDPGGSSFHHVDGVGGAQARADAAPDARVGCMKVPRRLHMAGFHALEQVRYVFLVLHGVMPPSVSPNLALERTNGLAGIP